MTTRDDILTELEILRCEGNNPRVTLWQMRRIYRRRAALFAQLAQLETMEGEKNV